MDEVQFSLIRDIVPTGFHVCTASHELANYRKQEQKLTRRTAQRLPEHQTESQLALGTLCRDAAIFNQFH